MLAVIAWLVLAIVPGALLLLAVRTSGGLAPVLAAAPLVSLGLVHGWAVVLDVLGVSVTPRTVLPVVLGLPVVVALIALRRRGGLRLPGPGLGRPESWIVAGVCLVAVALWWHASVGASLVPPNDDGTNHGLYTTRILSLGTVSPTQVTLGDLATGTPPGTYYPLALHTAAALVSDVTGAPVGTSLVIAAMLAAAVVLPLGLVVLTRRLFPNVRWAAPAAAMTAVVFPAFPYYPIVWGGLALIVGTAMLAPAIDLLVASTRERARVAGGFVAGLAGVGLFGLHSSEIVTAVVLAAVLVGGDLWRQGRGHWRAVAVPWAVAATVLAVHVLPQLGTLRAGVAVRVDIALIPPTPFFAALGDALAAFFVPETTLGIDASAVLGDRSGTFVVLALLGSAVLAALMLVGVVTTVRSRVRPEWAVCGLLVVVVATLSAMRAPGSDLLTFPWYSRWDRFALNEILFIAPYVGVGAAVVATRLARDRATTMVAALTAALVVVPALPQVANSRQVVGFGFAEASLADPQARSAFEFLATRVRPGDRVLNDITDGSGWMYSLNAVTPVFTSPPHDSPVWGDRLYLLNHATEVDTDPRARAAALQWRVRWVYVGPRLFPFRRPSLDRDALLASPSWRVVFDQDGALVLERVAGLSG